MESVVLDVILVNLMPRNAFGPLELVNLPSELNGSVGNNRTVGGRPQISAQNDVDAVRAWLARFIDTRTTFDSYRKEAERLLLWSVTELGKPLSLRERRSFLRQLRCTSLQPNRSFIFAACRQSRMDKDQSGYFWLHDPGRGRR